MCLAIPGRVVEIADEGNQLAKVDVSGVLRNVNVGLLDDVGPDNWMLIHVGFALSKVDEQEAQATLALLQEMGEAYEQELADLKASAICAATTRTTASPAATRACRCGCGLSATTAPRSPRTAPS